MYNDDFSNNCVRVEYTSQISCDDELTLSFS